MNLESESEIIKPVKLRRLQIFQDLLYFLEKPRSESAPFMQFCGSNTVPLVFDKIEIVGTNLNIVRELKKKAKKRSVPPSSYSTMPYYFPTEQVNIVKKIRSKKRRRTK